MKKNILFLTITFACITQAMEEGPLKNDEQSSGLGITEDNPSLSFEHLPREMLIEIVRSADSLTEAIRNLYKLRQVNHTLKEIVDDPITIKLVARAYIQNNLQKAEVELIGLIRSLERYNYNLKSEPSTTINKLRILNIFIDSDPKAVREFVKNYINNNLKEAEEIFHKFIRLLSFTADRPLLASKEEILLKLIKLFLDCGISSNTTFDPLYTMYLTPLESALSVGNTKLVELLLNAGADADLDNPESLLKVKWVLDLSSHLPLELRQRLMDLVKTHQKNKPNNLSSSKENTAS